MKKTRGAQLPTQGNSLQDLGQLPRCFPLGPGENGGY